jgi:hypothetical protein
MIEFLLDACEELLEIEIGFDVCRKRVDVQGFTVITGVVDVFDSFVLFPFANGDGALEFGDAEELFRGAVGLDL